MTTIRATGLTTFSVAADGGSVTIGVADDQGGASALVLPAACLQALVMSLPEMAQQALRRKHGDRQLRLVFPVETWTLETSTEAGRLILSFATAEGFRASFALFAEEFARMIEAAIAGETTEIVPPSAQQRN